mgnify:CR=1 FL=1
MGDVDNTNSIPNEISSNLSYDPVTEPVTMKNDR